MIQLKPVREMNNGSQEVGNWLFPLAQPVFDHRSQLCTDRVVYHAITKIGPADQAWLGVADAKLLIWRGPIAFVAQLHSQSPQFPRPVGQKPLDTRALPLALCRVV